MSRDDTWTSVSMPYVRPRQAGQADAWTEEAAQHGHVGSQRLREVAEVPSPPTAATALGTPAGDAVIVRRRTVLLDDRPVELADSYYPASIARGTPLAEPRKIPGGAVTLLAEMGYRPTCIEEDVTAQPATEEERQLLQLPANEWVLKLSRLSKTHDGTPVEFIAMTMVARGRHLKYETSL